MARHPAQIALWIAALLTAIACSAPVASASPLGEVHLFPTSGIFPTALAPGPEGEIWLGGSGTTGRISTSGVISTLDTSTTPTSRMVAGSDGNMWFADNDIDSTAIDRLTAAGEVTEFNAEGTYKPHWLTLGPEGDIWYTAGLPGLKLIGEGEKSAIGRVSPSGAVTEFTLKNEKSGLQEITTGPDGDLWFINASKATDAIGRVTPTGEIKEFTIPKKPWLVPSGIAPASDGNVYFGASGKNEGGEEENVIGEIATSGEVKIARRMEPAPLFLAAGPEGSLWFTAYQAEPTTPYVVGQLTPEGKLTEFTSFLSPEISAGLIAPGPDGNMWFTTFDNETDVHRVGVIGTGAPNASQTPPTVTGADQVGSDLACEGAAWASWAGQQPSASLYGFDGYTWLLDGHAISGQNAQTLSVPAADLGHQISCSVKATYNLLNVTVSASSAGVTIGAAPVVTPAHTPAPLVSALTLPHHQTDTVSSHGALHVTLDCSGAPCTGTVKLIYKYKVTTGKGRHKKTKTASVAIASGTFAALALGTDKVTLKLTSHGLSLLEAHGYKLGADASIGYISSGASHASTVGAIELKGTRPKRKG
jgi:streptogramin lyase